MKSCRSANAPLVEAIRDHSREGRSCTAASMRCIVVIITVVEAVVVAFGFISVIASWPFFSLRCLVVVRGTIILAQKDGFLIILY